MESNNDFHDFGILGLAELLVWIFDSKSAADSMNVVTLGLAELLVRILDLKSPANSMNVMALGFAGLLMLLVWNLDSKSPADAFADTHQLPLHGLKSQTCLPELPISPLFQSKPIRLLLCICDIAHLRWAPAQNIVNLIVGSKQNLNIIISFQSKAKMLA